MSFINRPFKGNSLETQTRNEKGIKTRNLETIFKLWFDDMLYSLTHLTKILLRLAYPRDIYYLNLILSFFNVFIFFFKSSLLFNPLN